MATVSVRYSRQLDAARWAERHAAGEVPDGMPYGLDRMQEAGVDVRADRPRPMASEFANKVARRLAGGYDWLPPWGGPADIVLCWDERAGVPAAMRSDVPVISGVIWLVEPGRAGHWTDTLARRGLERTAATLVLSRAQLDPLQRLRAHRPQWLPFGIDHDFWHPGGQVQEGYVVSVGNDRHRDHATLIDASERAFRSLGHGRLLLATRQYVAVPLQVGHRVEFLSHSMLRQRYQEAQVVVIATASNLHCSGITAILEAMACGRPVVATDTPGMSDYVRNGIDGVLVPPNDARALAEALASLLADPVACETMGRAGRLRVEERWTTARMARDLATIVREAV